MHRVRERPSWLAPPHEEAEEGQQSWESYEMREASEEEVASEPIPERRRTSALTLERVVPVAQKDTVDGITVAIASLELYGEGLGILRWRISLGEEALCRDPDLGFEIPEPRVEVQDKVGRVLPWSPRWSGSGAGEADGEGQVKELADTEELEVRVLRLVSDTYVYEEYLEDKPSHEGPWTFRFTL